MSFVEKVKEALEQAKKQVEETNTPTSVEIMENDRWVLQLLVTPGGTTQYGAVTVKRPQGVLLSIRSKVNWKNNLTLPDSRAFEALVELVNEFNDNEELKTAVLAQLTGRVKQIQPPTIKL